MILRESRSHLPLATALLVILKLAWSTPASADEVASPPLSSGSLSGDQFVNPIAEGADPWVIRDPLQPRYLWCLSDGNRAIAIHTSDSLTSLGTRHIVWRARGNGPCSRELWAPELHFLDGRWYVYFAASDGRNENHLTWVLKSRSSDPLGEYDLHGPLRTGDGPTREQPNIWAIDMTVLQHAQKRYAIWSGWDAPGTDRQYLYIAEMASPTKLKGPRVRLCDNDDFLWERVEPGLSHRGLHEGPQVVPLPGRTLLAYSCGASWLPTYKLGLLELTGDDPLNPQHWNKLEQPFFESTEHTFGIGHSCFAPSPDGTQWWHIFHAKRDRQPGWRRAIFVQPIDLNGNDIPNPGTPVRSGIPLPKPSGTPTASTDLQQQRFTVYGHHQFYSISPGEIRLGMKPDAPINDYRSGEKAMLHRAIPNDCVIAVNIDFQGKREARDAGVLFRTSAESVGYDAQRGYFAGLIPRTQLVILGRTDGTKWQELSRASAEIDAAGQHDLEVTIRGGAIEIRLNGQRCISHQDDTWKSGRVGVRVVDTDAIFRNLKVVPLQ